MEFKYNCYLCCYKTNDKRNWKKHNKTKKHLNNENYQNNENYENNKLIVKCEFCNKIYKTRQGYLWHYKNNHSDILALEEKVCPLLSNDKIFSSIKEKYKKLLEISLNLKEENKLISSKKFFK